MNQILATKIKNKKNKSYIFFFIFFISISSFIILILVIFSFFNNLNQKENITENILNTYSVYKLYSGYLKSEEKTNSRNNNIFGIIEIPKINIYYPVFSELNDELLKIAPCKFSGNSPKSNGNICIAGHNYNNSTFFSNLHLLKINDEIYLYDNLDVKYVYKVVHSYEVVENNLSPIFDYDKSTKQLTLITCNNLNSKRLIIKCTQI